MAISRLTTNLFCSRTLQGFTGVHIASIIATTWILMLNGAVGYQLIDDGTALSTLLMLISSALLFIGTGYIALDTGYNWSGYWATNQVQFAPNRSYALYTLYFLVPLVFLFIYFVLEAVLVVTVLGEFKPMSKSQKPFSQTTASPPQTLISIRYGKACRKLPLTAP